MSPTYGIGIHESTGSSGLINIPPVVLQFHVHLVDYHPAYGYLKLLDYPPLKSGIRVTKKDIPIAVRTQGRIVQAIREIQYFRHTGSIDCLHFDKKTGKVFSVVHIVHKEKMIGFEDNNGNKGVVVKATGALVNAWVDYYP